MAQAMTRQKGRGHTMQDLVRHVDATTQDMQLCPYPKCNGKLLKHTKWQGDIIWFVFEKIPLITVQETDQKGTKWIGVGQDQEAIIANVSKNASSLDQGGDD